MWPTFDRTHTFKQTHREKFNLERLSIRTPCLVSVSLESILMLNSLSNSRTKEMAPESGFMYSRHESFTTSQLQTHTHTHYHHHHHQDLRVCLCKVPWIIVYCCGPFSLTCLSCSERKDVGRQINTGDVGGQADHFQNVWDFLLFFFRLRVVFRK